MKKPQQDFERFLDLSIAMTGFSRVDLLGTGLAFDYFEKICSIVGEKVCDALWSVSAKILKQPLKKMPHPGARNSAITDAARDEMIRDELMSSPKYGPVVRNLIILWYLGQWDALPGGWRAIYGSNTADIAEIISPASYKEGLVWIAIGAHPMGAKQPGFGTWSSPPIKPH